MAPVTGGDEFYLGATRRAAPRRASLPKAVLIDRVLPVLRSAVARGPGNVASASLLALARAGVDHPEFARIDVIARKLADRDQSVRETAALALGLAGDANALPQLCALVRDDAAGRKLLGAHVDQRTRSFAAYGLGLLARADRSVAVHEQVFDALDQALSQTGSGVRELRVAAAQAIGLMALDRRSYAGTRLQERMIARLSELVEQALAASRGDVSRHEVAAHSVTAMARLLGRDHYASGRYREQFSALLSGRSPTSGKRLRVPHVLSQSCALALGQMAEVEDASIRRRLLDAWQGHKDAQTRSFALLALGRIGGDTNRALLFKEFRRASANIERPWCALALGLLASKRHEESGKPDGLVIETLEATFARAKNPEASAALAVALGLADADGAADLLAKRLKKSVAKPLLAASVCDALTMIAEPAGKDALRAVLADAGRRPALLQRASVALARLGDRSVAEDLVQRLVAGESNYAMQLALAGALADIGDQRQLEPLLRLLGDSSRSAVTRASAARALGGIAERGRSRWNTALRQNTNYRANVATLTDRSAGVMDLR